MQREFNARSRPTRTVMPVKVRRATWADAARSRRRRPDYGVVVMRGSSVSILKLVGMSRGWSESLGDLGCRGLDGVSGRVEVALAGVVDGVISGHDRDETLGVAGSRS